MLYELPHAFNTVHRRKDMNDTNKYYERKLSYYTTKTCNQRGCSPCLKINKKYYQNSWISARMNSPLTTSYMFDYYEHMRRSILHAICFPSGRIHTFTLIEDVISSLVVQLISSEQVSLIEYIF